MAEDKLSFKMTKPAMMLYAAQAVVPQAYAPFGKKPKQDAKKVYSCQMVFDPDHPDVATQKQMILQAGKAKFPGLDIAAEVKAGKFKVPFSSGDKIVAKRTAKLLAAGKADDHKLDFLKGKVVFKAASDFPTALGVRIKGQGDIDVNEDNKSVHKDAFYNGCSGLWGVSYRAYDAVNDSDDAKPGVKAYLDIVHSLNTGARIQLGGRSAAEAFKGVAGAAVDESVVGNDLDDEIPF